MVLGAILAWLPKSARGDEMRVRPMSWIRKCGLFHGKSSLAGSLLAITISFGLLNGSSAYAQVLIPLEWPSEVVELAANTEADPAPVITDIALQPDGPLVALVGDDHFLRLVERQSGRVVAKLEGHRDWIRKVAFTQDGQWIITAGNDRRLLKWSPTLLGAPTEIATMDFAISALSIDPTGRFVAVGGFGDRLHIINLAESKTVLEIVPGCNDIRAIAFSPDGMRLAAAGRDGVLRLFDSLTGDLVYEEKIHTRRIHDLEFLAEDGRIITCADDLTIKLTDPSDPTRNLSIDSKPAKVMTVEQLDRGLLASAGTDNQIRIWDVNKGTEVGQLYGHEGSITSLAFDGTRLFSTGYDTHLRIWRVNANFAATETPGPRISSEPSRVIE